MISTLEARFWIKVDRSGDCWEWMAARNPYRGDYGIFSPSKGKTVTAHRMAWELAHGPIPDGMQVCHTCDNPPCVRLDHLFLGTNRANVTDKIAKGRSGRDFRLPKPQIRTVRWPTARIVAEPVPRTARAQRERVQREHRKRMRKSTATGLPSKAIRIPDSQVQIIRSRHASGERVGVLAREYDVHRHTISNIIASRSRKEVR